MLDAPLIVPASQLFDGSDGAWSTFLINIGNPGQAFRVLPATNGQETWVPVPEGCTGPVFPANCGNSRGVDVFNYSQSLGFSINSSSTWQSLSPSVYNLIMEGRLGMNGDAVYGFDSVGLGHPQNGSQNGPFNHVMDHQIIAGFADTDFWLGFLPLSEKPANFSNPVPSYLTNLASTGKIPSRSFGYTAGARYQGGTLGSLVLGGYDSARIASHNNVSFPFYSDDSYSLSVNIQSITAQRTLAGSVAPLVSPILSLIDSGVPEIWLPQSACSIFEQAFGLIYDNDTDRYLINDTVHSQLQHLNSSLVFTLGTQPIGGPTVAIELPYAAFDLQISFPIYSNSTNYFPLRRAANSTQYTLGRTFLQESFIIVDYERQNFSVSQAAFTSSQHIIPVLRPSTSSHHLSPDTIAGISIACTALLSLLCFIMYILVRRYRRTQLQKQLNRRKFFGYESTDFAKPIIPTTTKHELPGASPFILQGQFHRTPNPRESPLPPSPSPSTTAQNISPLSPNAIRQELAGTFAAAEAHTSGHTPGSRPPPPDSPGSPFSSPTDQPTISSLSEPRSATDQVYELSGEPVRQGVRIKSVWRDHGRRSNVIPGSSR